MTSAWRSDRGAGGADTMVLKTQRPVQCVGTNRDDGSWHFDHPVCSATPGPEGYVRWHNDNSARPETVPPTPNLRSAV